MDDAELLTVIEDFKDKLIQYGNLLARDDYKQAEEYRSQAAQMWGEIEEDVLGLGVDQFWQAAGRMFPIFEGA